MDTKDIAKAVINYVVPLMLGTVVSMLKPFGDLPFWSAVVLSWRGIVICISVMGVYLIQPSFSLWAGLVSGLVLAAHRVGANYLVVRPRPMTLLFAGFYTYAADGRLHRSAYTSTADSEFLARLTSELAQHRVQNVVTLKIEDFRLPKIIHSWFNFEDFRRLMRRHATKSLVVIWGVVNSGGKLERLEIDIDPTNYYGGDDFVAMLDRFRKHISVDGLEISIVLKFYARLIAVLWGQSPGDMLNKAGFWRESLAAASDSRLFAEKALADLVTEGGIKAAPVEADLRKSFLPIFLRQEACGLYYGGLWRPALNKLIEALKIDLMFPYDEVGFFDFYNNRYAWEVLGREKEHHHLQTYFRDRAKVIVAPSLQLLDDWIEAIAQQGNMTESLVDNLFSGLVVGNESNPFLYLYWGDAIKAANKIVSPKLVRLPLKVMAKALVKYHQAYSTRPHPIIAIRLGAGYMLSAYYYSPDSYEAKSRMDKAMEYYEIGQRWFHETLPMILVNPGTSEDPDFNEKLEKRLADMSYLFGDDPVGTKE